jgi:hypothetical protein
MCVVGIIPAIPRGEWLVAALRNDQFEDPPPRIQYNLV